MSGFEEKCSALYGEGALLSPEWEPVEWLTACQSPIEKLMLLALWSRGVWSGKLTFPDFVGDSDLAVLEERAKALRGTKGVLAPQVSVGPYRVDFLIVLSRWYYRDVVLVAVECDGHEFHERTKAQAAKDKARDRDLAARGLTVLRFTGSEIFRNAGACADDVIQFVQMKSTDDIYAEYQRQKADEYIPERHQ